MSFDELLNKAQENKAIADDVFKQNFLNRTIEYLGECEYIAESIEGPFDITINTYEVFEKVLKKFGHLMEKMNIQLYKSNDEDRFNVASLIGRYASHSLKSIRLAFCNTKMVDKFERTFTKLEDLTISGDLAPSSAIYSARPLKKLNEIFPKLRNLSLDYIALSDPTVVNVEFESLEYVYINFLNVPYDVPADVYSNYTKPTMTNLLEKNSFVQRVSLDGCYSLDFLKIVANHATILHELNVNFANFIEEYDGPKMNFPHLKKLSVTLTKKGKFFKNMNFPELKELFITCTAKSCIDFPKKNEQLIRLHIDGYKFKNQTISKLDQRAPNLEDLYIKGSSDIDMNSLIDYIEESLTLKKIRFVNRDDSIFGNLTSHFAQDWNVNQNKFIITLERKN